ncbi:DUF1642 domain-containing protein [Lactococcus lactis]|uniref:DUF1642 domain-containing protein n=1 Tax=Lactococcus lactis subsp. lactis TaxID=1360 RepID=A0A2R7Y0A5_LACLL|nr:DUF1642 domain-containing protein [Lactococcus lactis]PUA16132.1 hypothetical protein CYU10_000323 [Lactococcus lactis subsp. lactis]
MTKFEEEAIKEAKKCGYVMAKSKIDFYEDEKGITFVDFNDTHTNFNFPWLEFAKNWHSDEDFQIVEEIGGSFALANKNLIDANTKLTKEIANLKSQLQQQALPVVPECVAEWIEHCKGMGYGLIAALTFKLSSTMNEELSAKILKWLDNEGNDETFALAFITGKYEVEKPQLFYLKNKLTTSYLILDTSTGYFEHWGSTEATGRYKSSFTQQEIGSMETESYEQIEVEK